MKLTVEALRFCAYTYWCILWLIVVWNIDDKMISLAAASSKIPKRAAGRQHLPPSITTPPLSHHAHPPTDCLLWQPQRLDSG